jgi:hypothetical protein
MANYKVISSSCYGGNKVFYSGEIFKDHDVSEQDLSHLLSGGYIKETEDDATNTNEISVQEVVAEKEPEKIEILAPEEVQTEGESFVDTADLLADKKQGKNTK